MQLLTSQIKNYFSNATVAITGANGYLGGQLVATLSNISCKIIKISRAPSTNTESNNITTLAADYNNPDFWETVLSQVDVIFHLAGETSAYKIENDPLASIAANILPMVNMLHACKKNNKFPAIIFAGSATEVGMPKQTIVNESLADHPITIYDLHKLIAEQHLKYFANNNYVHGVTLRLANVYGPGNKVSSNDRGILNKLVQLAITQNNITLYGDGTPIRDYVYIDDVINAFLLAAVFAKQISGKHFVIGSGAGISLKNTFKLIAAKVEQYTSKAVLIKTINWPQDVLMIEKRNFTADISAFSNATGWQPTVSLPTGIEQLIACYNN